MVRSVAVQPTRETTMNRLPPIDRRPIQDCETAETYCARKKTSKLVELARHPNEYLRECAREELDMRDEQAYEEECWRESMGIPPTPDSPSLEDRFGDAWAP